MNENTINERYMLSRKAYITRKEFQKLLMIDSEKKAIKIWQNLRVQIQDYLKNLDKELIDEKLLPTDLIFKFLDNQQVIKQIEKDYMSIIKK